MKYRINEYRVLFQRIILVFFFYFLAKILFTLYNYELLESPSFLEFFRLYYYSILFDAAAIFYVNGLFILLSLLPLFYNTSKKFQKVLFVIYFVFNLLAFATSFIDFIYFKYNFARTTLSMLETVQNESNLWVLFSGFLVRYWHVTFLFMATSWLWVFLYKKIRLEKYKPKNAYKYIGSSLLATLIIVFLIVVVIRGGDTDLSTRPINLVDANRHVKSPIQANIVSNTPFAMIRTINKKSIVRKNYLPQEKAIKLANPFKYYTKDSLDKKKNVVVFIIESFGREYLGAFNQHLEIKDYKSYTPFIDSLAKHSLIFPNAFTNGNKSIHGMSSVLAGIPSFKDAYTSSPYSTQEIESLISVAEGMDYKTSFFHGAANGSMGFSGFSNILGIDNYFGRTEFNDESQFDGHWGIWDEPFLQYMKEELDKEQEPFLSTVFTVTSHDPYNIPKKYKDKFPAGNNRMHKCVGYTDYAIKRFFEEAKKSTWYHNTIFVMVADHSNLLHYPQYKNLINYASVPILFFSPDETYKGVDYGFAQQIDIYPTLLDMLGYDKPFRSWGRSLIGNEEPFVMRYTNGIYYFMYKDHIYCFDGEKTVGLYHFSDTKLEKDLQQQKSQLLTTLEEKCKAYIQDYMYRISERKLTKNQP